MADEQPSHSVEVMDSIPESRPASPTIPEATLAPQRRDGGSLALPPALRTTPMPTIRDDGGEPSSSRHQRGHSTSNSLHPVESSRSRARAGSTASSVRSKGRRSVNMQRAPTGIPGMRKRTTTWNLNGPSALDRQGTFRRRGTYNLGGGMASGNDVGDDARSAAGFTLAGPGNAIEAIMSNQAYIDPGYVDLNPAYEVAPNNRPVWGLAKPLPHVVRPGMIPTRSEIIAQTPGQMRHEEQAMEEFDLEAGRVDQTLNPQKISSALQAAQQDREFRLMRTYTGQKAFGGGSNYQRSSAAAGFRRPSMVSEVMGKVDSQDNKRNSTIETITRLASVTEKDTPDETLHPNDGGWLADDAHATTPINEHMDEGVWEEEDEEELKPYDPELDEIHNLHTHWSVIRLKFREPLAELLAITCQLTIGFCADLTVLCSGGATTTNTNVAWGLAAMIGIYIAGGISGAHLNPAMSLMLWIFRGFPLRKIPSYGLAQILGAFLAALISFGLFRTSILELAQTTTLANTGSTSSFLTYPREDWIDPVTAFFSEFTGTTILAVVVLALGDDSNAPPGAGMNAFIMGLVVTALSMALSFNTGLAMNPARDVGPRLALLALGYGTEETFGQMGGSYWFWGSWCGPIAGALFGAFLYDAAIFVGGESPVNYPRRRIKRALKKKRNNWSQRFKSLATGMKIRRPKYASDEWRFEVHDENSVHQVRSAR